MRLDQLSVTQSREPTGVLRLWCSLRTSMHLIKLVLRVKIPTRSSQLLRFCGQSRITFRARQFATLIGPFRIGEHAILTAPFIL
jgi:hypothetical protein